MSGGRSRALALAVACLLGLATRADGAVYKELKNTQCAGATVDFGDGVTTLTSAKAECNNNANCSGVWDEGCGIATSSTFYMCGRGVIYGKAKTGCAHVKQDPRGEKCALERGAVSATATASAAMMAAYKRRTGKTLMLHADYHQLCVAIMERHHAGHDLKKLKNRKFTIPRKVSTKAQTMALEQQSNQAANMNQQRRRLQLQLDIPVQFTPKAGKPQVYSVMDLCTSPCLHQGTGNTCCPVPANVAPKLACCRSGGCCPDQTGSRRRMKRASGMRQHDPRKLPGVAASVSVEESSSNQNTYDQLMACLNQPGKTAAKCGIASSSTGGAPTSAPTSTTTHAPTASG